MSPTPLRLALVASIGLLGAAPALAQAPAPPVPPAPPIWDDVTEAPPAIGQALREAEAAMREAMREVRREVTREMRREVTREMRDLDRHIASATRDARWTARTWTECQRARRGPEQTERIARSFKVGPNGTLTLANVSGDITIQAAQGDTIAVEAIKRARGDAADQFARTQVEMNERAGRVEVRVVYTGQRNHASVDFNVTAPPGTSLDIRSVSGNVRITGIHGDVRSESVSGNVNAVDVAGASQLKSVSGNIDVSAVKHERDLRLESVSGNVTVRDAQVRGLSAETVSGELRLVNVTGSRVGAKSVSGGVNFSGPLAQGGRYEMKSHSGDVRVAVANDAGFEIEATSFSGNVRSDLPITVGGPGRGAVRTGRGHQALRGVHGDASALLSLTTFSGSIVVTKR